MKLRYHLLLLALTTAVTFALYGDMLWMPLYLDDAILWLYVDQSSIIDLFTRVEMIPFYRPISFIPWKLIILAGFGHTAWIYYVFNLLIHALNGYLVGVLAWKLFARDGTPTRHGWQVAGWLAAVIYLVFPFSYQAVTWVSSVGHLMVALGALVAANALEVWWKNGERRWPLAVVWLSMTVAAFSHENGVIVPFLLLLPFILSRERWREWRRAAVAVLPCLGIAAVYVVFFLLVPRPRDNSPVPLIEQLSGAIYYSQGIGLPLAQFGAAAWKTFDLSRELVAGVLGIGGGVIGLALAGRAGFYGGLWYMISMVLSVIFLTYEYTLGGPRLMLLASVGTALLWAAAVARLWNGRLAFRLAGAALAAMIVIPSAAFVVGEMAMHRTLARLYNTMLDETGQNPSTVFINLPAWIAYRNETFALGSEGVIYMADYVNYSDLIYANTGKRTENPAVSFDAVYPNAPDYWWDALRDDRSPDEIAALVRETGSGYALNIVGGNWVWENAVRGGEAGQEQTFANGMALTVVGVRDGDPVAVRLSWRVETPQPVTAFIHLVCDGSLVSQSDGAPLRGLLTFESWSPGESWTETRYLDGAQAGGDCHIRVGLYDPISGERVLTQDGAEWVEVNLRP
jgi:hypothetical protein